MSNVNIKQHHRISEHR